jgi:hypothetical protein
LSVLLTTDYWRGLPQHESAGQIRTEALDGLGDPAPHPRRAAVIADMLETGLAAASAFEAALDASRSGVVLVDSNSSTMLRRAPCSTLATRSLSRLAS